MGVRVVVPDSVFGGFYKKGHGWAIGILAHSLQCDQVWLFLLRCGKFRFGYRTHGDASPKMMTYYDAGFHWPWQVTRTVSGRG